MALGEQVGFGGAVDAGCHFNLPPLAASQFFSVVLIIFIAEIAAAVVVLVYTSLVSGLAGSWAGTFWDSSNPFRKTGGLGLLPVGWKDGTPNSGAGSVGGQGQPGWVEGLPEVQATRRGSHCPKETSIIIQVLPTACF